jgi:ribosomal protein S18 acetylase RimI-like enzyme
MAIEVRILGSSDTALLLRVAPAVFDNALDPALVREFLADPRHHIAAALEDGVVVGFAIGVHYIHPDKPAELFVNEVGVAPTHRRRGLAAAAVRALFERGHQVGCELAWVLTDKDNVAGNALYASLGGVDGAEGLGEEIKGFTFRLGGSGTS